jgi:hypothetical protein
MNPDDKKPATSTAAGFAPAPGKVEGTDPNYPPYVVEFSGGTIVDSNGTTVPLVKVTGPHTFSLLQPGGGSFTVSLTRSESDGIRPNLSIKFT